MQETSDFQNARRCFLTDADALRAPFFYFSPVNVVPKLWLDKLTVVDLGTSIGLADTQGSVRVVPMGTQAEYYGAVVAALGKFKSVLLLPEWIADHLNSKKQKKSLQHREYMMDTDAVRRHPGGANAAVRGNINKARRLCEIEVLRAETLPDFLAVNQIWYRQVADAKFRTYDKVSIDTMLKRWDELQASYPDALCYGIRETDTGRLISLNIGSALTAGVWTAYTQRFDREAVKAANSLGYVALAEHFEQPMENDGTADSKEIRAWKDRLGAPSLAAYRIDR